MECIHKSLILVYFYISNIYGRQTFLTCNRVTTQAHPPHYTRLSPLSHTHTHKKFWYNK